MALERLRALGIDPGIVHLANSAAIVTRPETWADMVRPGRFYMGIIRATTGGETRGSRKAIAVEAGDEFAFAIISLRNVPAGAVWDTTPRLWPSGRRASGCWRRVRRRHPPFAGKSRQRAAAWEAGANRGIISMDVTMIDVTDVESAAIGTWRRSMARTARKSCRRIAWRAAWERSPRICFAG